MILPKRFTAEKTTFITVGGTTVPVASFSDQIIQEFEVLDKMKQDAANITYQLEMYAHAIKSKTAELSTMISEFYKVKTEPNKEVTKDAPPQQETE